AHTLLSPLCLERPNPADSAASPPHGPKPIRGDPGLGGFSQATPPPEVVLTGPSRLILQHFLYQKGECHVAINGEEAVEAYRNSLNSGAPYELICMDIQMPGCNGVEAVKKIRAIEEADGVLSSNGVKILMTTAAEDPKDVIQSFNALCDDYLIKPIQAATLLDKLRSIDLIQ
ncbi:MAG TPA: response regulator, partial [Terracidiphilus sp.]